VLFVYDATFFANSHSGRHIVEAQGIQLVIRGTISSRSRDKISPERLSYTLRAQSVAQPWRCQQNRGAVSSAWLGPATFWHSDHWRTRSRTGCGSSGFSQVDGRWEFATGCGHKSISVRVHTQRGPEQEISTKTLGVTGVVKKTRTLYLIGQTRVHIDEVEGLGTFVELEVMLGVGQSEVEGRTIAEALMAQFGIDKQQVLPEA
jgi:hypothetical protein